MKRFILLVVIVITITILIKTNIFAEITKIVSFFYALKLTQPSVGILGDVLIASIAGPISYWIVGKFFNRLSFHKRKIMSLAYLVICTVVAFGLSTLAHNLFIC